jgi:hypothetical protein
MMHWDWFLGFAGGLMIGGAASAYLLFNGRVMGISGIFGGLVDGSGWGDWRGAVAFVAGLVALPWGLSHLMPAATHLTGNIAVIVAGGLLVGVGTRLANGCTSGHGVCGMSRLSLRSIVATVFYLLAGGVTMALLRHALGVL